MNRPSQTDFLGTIKPTVSTPPHLPAILRRLDAEWRRFHNGEPLLPLKTIVQITPEGRQALHAFMKRTKTKTERNRECTH
jgi:hypothetical protein